MAADCRLWAVSPELQAVWPVWPRVGITMCGGRRPAAFSGFQLSCILQRLQDTEAGFGRKCSCDTALHRSGPTQHPREGVRTKVEFALWPAFSVTLRRTRTAKAGVTASGTTMTAQPAMVYRIVTCALADVLASVLTRVAGDVLRAVFRTTRRVTAGITLLCPLQSAVSAPTPLGP